MLHALLHPISFRRDHRYTADHAWAYVDGELAEADAARVDRHMRLCPPCREMIDGMRRMLGGLTGLRRAARPTAPSDLTSSILSALDESGGDPARGPATRERDDGGPAP